jgi:Lipase (class 3)
MNSFDLACAILSSTAYRIGYHLKNQIDAAPGAVQLPGSLGYKALNGTSGFEASAFEYDGKIIISYAGTNPDYIADLVTNGALALGINHPQLKQAAEFYAAIKNNPAYAGKEVVFTGHSLGGGLAAAMGVFFNKRAVTFDPAPPSSTVNCVSC